MELAGTREVTIEKGWDTVKEFVDDLNEALSEEEQSIRETTLDKSGGFKKAHLRFADSNLDRVEDIFMDTLGRVVLPPEQEYQELQSVAIIEVNGGKQHTQAVVSLETRFEGEHVSAFVIYLEAKE